MLVSSHFFRIAGISPAHAQATPPPTRVNPDFSRIYIFVDKSGVVGHSHAIEGKIAEGNLSLRSGSHGKLVFDMTSFDADFTLHGKTRHVESICDLELKDGWYHLRGNFKIRQSDYEIKPYSKMLGTIGVADELVIHGDLWIVPE